MLRQFELSEAEDDDLLGCPYCGVESIDGYTDGTGWWLQCRDCQAQGPYAANRLIAIYAWQRRYPALHYTKVSLLPQTIQLPGDTANEKDPAE